MPARAQYQNLYNRLFKSLPGVRETYSDHQFAWGHSGNVIIKFAQLWFVNASRGMCHGSACSWPAEYNPAQHYDSAWATLVQAPALSHAGG